MYQRNRNAKQHTKYHLSVAFSCYYIASIGNICTRSETTTIMRRIALAEQQHHAQSSKINVPTSTRHVMSAQSLVQKLSRPSTDLVTQHKPRHHLTFCSAAVDDRTATLAMVLKLCDRVIAHATQRTKHRS